MPKLLSDKVCRNRLTKYIEGNYSEEQQDVIEYFNDLVTVNSYSFKYYVPHTKLKVLLTIDRATQKIRTEYWT